MDLSLWYLGPKLLAYSTWMFVGLEAMRPDARPRVASALALGALRLCMGLGFGFVIWLLGTVVFAGVLLASPHHDDFLPTIVTYAAVYVPVRWVEWGIFEVALQPSARAWDVFTLSADPRVRRWRLGGIVISCLADVPVMIALGGVLPVGRFLC